MGLARTGQTVKECDVLLFSRAFATIGRPQ
jgi:hypothetical protein